MYLGNRNIIIGVIYRPPNTDLKLLNDSLNDLLDTLGRERKYCNLMGDFNINLLNFDKHAETTSFVDMLRAQSFVSFINRPTRVTKNSATLINNIFTNCYCNIENTFQCLIYTNVSDHFPIVHIDFEMQLCDTDTAVNRRNLSYKNRQGFYECVLYMCAKVYEDCYVYNVCRVVHIFLYMLNILLIVFILYF